LFVQAALIFIVFSLVRTKLPHYTLPAFPAVSLWLALRTRELVQAPKWLTVGTTAMCLLGLAVTWGGFSVARRYFVAANLWRQAQPYCSAEMKLASIGFNEPSLVWEFRRGLTNYLQQLHPQEAGPFLQSPGPRILIVPTAAIAELGTLSTNYLTFRASGLDTARFRRIDLTAVVKTGR